MCEKEKKNEKEIVQHQPYIKAKKGGEEGKKVRKVHCHSFDFVFVQPLELFVYEAR